MNENLENPNILHIGICILVYNIAYYDIIRKDEENSTDDRINENPKLLKNVMVFVNGIALLNKNKRA